MDACKNYKDIILSDHIDGELDKAAQAQLQAHLAACPACRAFEAEVRQGMVVPFKQARHEAVPAHLWASIKDRITAEPAPGPLAEFIRGLAGSFSLPKLAPALMGVAALALVGSLVFHDQDARQVQAQVQVQGEYVVSVLASAENIAADTDNEGAETPIETYFL